MNETAYPLPTYPAYHPPPHANAKGNSVGGVDVPSLEPFIAANLILAPNPWCHQPPAAYYKYPPRTSHHLQPGAVESREDADEEGEGDEEAGAAVEDDSYFGAEYLDIPNTAATTQFNIPTEENRGEKRKRAEDESDRIEEQAPVGQLEPDSLEIAWEEGVHRRGRGRPKGSRDSKPRDLSRTHRYRSIHSGAFVSATHEDAVLDVGDDLEPIQDGQELRRRVMKLAGKFYADLADLLERSSAHAVEECTHLAAGVGGLGDGVEGLVSRLLGAPFPRPSSAPVRTPALTPPVSSITSPSVSDSRPTTAGTQSTLVDDESLRKSLSPTLPRDTSALDAEATP